MAEKPVIDSDRMWKFYEGRIKRRADSIQDGKMTIWDNPDLCIAETVIEAVRESNPNMSEPDRYATSLEVFGEKVGSHSVLNTARKEVLLGAVYDKLQKMHRDSRLKNENLATEPLLGVALEEYSRMDRAAFITKLAPVAYGQQPHFLVRPLALLEVIANNPELDIERGFVKFPHRSFVQTESGMSVPDMDKEIAVALPELYSPALVSLCKTIGELVTGGHADVQKSIAGPYTMLKGGTFRWINADPTYIQDRLSPLEDWQTRKDVYVALAEVFQLGIESKRKVKKGIRTKHSRFALSKNSYVLAGSALDRYAKNQILFGWLGRGYIPTTPVTKVRGLSGEEVAGELHIKQGNGHSICRRDSDYRPTVSSTPFVLALLNRFYREAVPGPEVSAQAK